MTIADRVAELYGQALLRKSAMNIRGGAGVFEKLLSGKGYHTLVEIGTYRGVSAAEMSQYVDRVITFDLRNGKLEKNGESFDRYQFWGSLGINNIKFYSVDDNEEKMRIIDTIDFDFAFIDGAHDYASVKADFELVKRCGRVLFHDADANPFVSELPKSQIELIDIFAYWNDSPDRA